MLSVSTYFHDSSPLPEQIADDPWKLLIAVTLLNKTCGKLAVPAFWDIIAKWPTPLDLAQGEPANISALAALTK